MPWDSQAGIAETKVLKRNPLALKFQNVEMVKAFQPQMKSPTFGSVPTGRLASNIDSKRIFKGESFAQNAVYIAETPNPQRSPIHQSSTRTATHVGQSSLPGIAASKRSILSGLVSPRDYEKNEKFQSIKQKYTGSTSTLLQEQKNLKEKLQEQRNMVKRLKGGKR